MALRSRKTLYPFLFNWKEARSKPFYHNSLQRHAFEKIRRATFRLLSPPSRSTKNNPNPISILGLSRTILSTYRHSRFRCRQMSPQAENPFDLLESKGLHLVTLRNLPPRTGTSKLLRRASTATRERALQQLDLSRVTQSLPAKARCKREPLHFDLGRRESRPLGRRQIEGLRHEPQPEMELRLTDPTSGINRCKLRTNASLLKDRFISIQPSPKFFFANFQNPGKVIVSKESLKLKLVL